MIDNVTSKMILWRVSCPKRSRSPDERKAAAVLRVQVKLSVDKHYIIHNRSDGGAAAHKAKDNSDSYLHIIILRASEKGQPTSW